MPDADRAEATAAVRRLEQWGDRRDWLGPDPYEGLNAERLRWARRTRLGRRLVIQAVKRCPVDLRPLLGIRHRHNAVGAANVASAYARSTFLPADERDAKLRRAVDRLMRLRLEYDGTPCWGYHFDVETRVFFYPRTMPNTIATAFAGMALLDAHEALGDERLLAAAVGAGDFFLRHIPQTQARGGAYFGYFVGDSSPIHNANMLVCGLLARLARHVPRADFREAATAGASYCVAHQRADGSWPYGERPNLQWVDGFHTGYVLDALLECNSAELLPAATPAFERGLAYYRRELFRADGAARYTNTSLYPIDAQCVAQGIQTFARAAAVEPSAGAWAWRVARWGLDHMQRSNGAFVFQRRRLWRNATPHVRWVQAPMFLALSHLVTAGQVSASDGVTFLTGSDTKAPARGSR